MDAPEPALGRLAEEIQAATRFIAGALHNHDPVQIAYLSGLGYGTITAIRRGDTKQAQPETLDAIWRAMEKVDEKGEEG